MKNVFFLLLIFCSSLFSKEENRWFIKGGIAVAQMIPSNDVKLKYADNYGVGREWTFDNNISLSLGLDYLEKGGTIKDKPVSPIIAGGVFPQGKEVYNRDIVVDITFIEIPLLAKYQININNEYKIKLLSGISYSIPYSDASKTVKKEYLFEYGQNNFPFEYRFADENTFGNYKAGYIINFGAEIVYKFLSVEFKYFVDSRDVIWCHYLDGFKKDMNGLIADIVLYF